jgi:hypothetical protein
MTIRSRDDSDNIIKCRSNHKGTLVTISIRSEWVGQNAQDRA